MHKQIAFFLGVFSAATLFALAIAKHNPQAGTPPAASCTQKDHHQ